jgi:DNA-binding GntR family transcriptional regulator
LLKKSDRYTRVQLSSDAARRRAASEHAQLIALARQGQVEEACTYLAAHIEAVRTDLLNMVKRPVIRPASAAPPLAESAGRPSFAG